MIIPVNVSAILSFFKLLKGLTRMVIGTTIFFFLKTFVKNQVSTGRPPFLPRAVQGPSLNVRLFSFICRMTSTSSFAGLRKNDPDSSQCNTLH